jgi:hypothetical protein
MLTIPQLAKTRPEGSLFTMSPILEQLNPINILPKVSFRFLTFKPYN